MRMVEKKKRTPLSCMKIIILLVAASSLGYGSRAEEARPSSASADDRDDDSPRAGRQDAGQGGGRIVQSLFRFPASQLGPEFDELLQNWHTGPLRTNGTPSSSSSSAAAAAASNRSLLPIITPEASGKAHAFYSVATPAATIFRRQCYGPAPRNNSTTLRYNTMYKNLEQRRKSIQFEYMKDSVEEMRVIHTMIKRIHPAFLPPEDENDKNEDNNSGRRMHKKKSRSTADTIYAQSTLPPDYDSPSKLAFQTTVLNDDDDDDDDNNNNATNADPKTQQWTWQPPAHFSSRGTPDNMPFRINTYNSMRRKLQRRLQDLLPDRFEDGFEYGRQSGMFWYPPGGVREWHSNYLDLVGNTKKDKKDGGSGTSRQQRNDEKIFASQVWRMYFVRTVRDEEFDEELTKSKKKKSGDAVDRRSNNDHSAMHIIPGEDAGITLDVLQKAGARPLRKEEEKRQWSDEFAEDYSEPPSQQRSNDESSSQAAADDGSVLDRNSVWRIPDRDGYVTLFRLPDIWHCIVSEEVHRYSLGFAFSDREVQALLKLAGVDFDAGANEKVEDGDVMDKKDEL